ncbi:NADPH-dependent F420 reductase [Herbiconiux sp. P15]|uniref:NADPH-dependent F420 reductase n=1 Tax=Herbiconiux liukaitaii TaxID=3342799 RepID=UPI0035B87518
MPSQPSGPQGLRIGIIGAGRVGTAIARAAVAAGHSVSVAGSGTPDELALVARFTMPGTRIGSASDVTAHADLVVLAVPLKKFATLDPAVFAGRTVIDVMNYWEPLDGHVPGFSDAEAPTSELVQRALPLAEVVKTLNHIGYHELEADARPPGAPDRRALAISSDHEEAARLVADFIDSLGYDPVFTGPLSGSAVLQPGTPIFDDRLDADRTRAALGTTASTARTALQEA